MSRSAGHIVGMLLAPMLCLAACSGSEEAVEAEDPSKLSAELEARAKQIEARADEAVAEVERDAAAELAELKSDVEQAEPETQ